MKGQTLPIYLDDGTAHALLLLAESHAHERTVADLIESLAAAAAWGIIDPESAQREILPLAGLLPASWEAQEALGYLVPPPLSDEGKGST